jgi:hypothetical protein
VDKTTVSPFTIPDSRRAAQHHSLIQIGQCPSDERLKVGAVTVYGGGCVTAFQDTDAVGQFVPYQRQGGETADLLIHRKQRQFETAFEVVGLQPIQGKKTDIGVAHEAAGIPGFRCGDQRDGDAALGCIGQSTGEGAFTKGRGDGHDLVGGLAYRLFQKTPGVMHLVGEEETLRGCA